ncbi:MAG TPA: ATP-binding protein [Kofleriaceae bacterium]|nr:ATP-binding protein [Kofleriaceae bacterium]
MSEALPPRGARVGVGVGVVLGSMDASPLEFWIGVTGSEILELDDLVVAEVALRDGRRVSFFGIVDVVRKRYEGSLFDSDAFRHAEGTLPVEVSYAAHVQVTRVDPEVFVPPQPGNEVRIARGDEFQRALFIDRMPRKLAIGATRTGEPVFANVDFLDGTRGAHASISGISGVATKTSYATFLLYSLFHGDALGIDAANARALIFNVKGEDLLWLDKPNVRNADGALAEQYARLGLPAGPFDSVGFFAPAHRRSADVIMPEVGSRHEGVSAYVWTLREVAEEHLLRFAFPEANDARSQLSFLIHRVERSLARAAKDGAAGDPSITVFGQRLRSFDDLVELLDSDVLDQMVPKAAPGTLDAFRRRLHGAAQHMGHLVRGDREAMGHRIDWQRQRVTVVDIHTLHEIAQMFVVGVLLKRMMADKEIAGTARPLVFVVLDELNKYAPRTGWSPIQDVLLDIAERGRSLGVCLFGAQQTASEVERRIIANAAVKVVGRLDAAEAERGEYGFLTRVARQRATMLSPGTMIVAQPELPTPILLRFPFPCWATRQGEVAAAPGGVGPGGVGGGAEDPFAGFS